MGRPSAQERAEPLDLAVGPLFGQRRLAEHLVDPVEVVELKIVGVLGVRHQLPPDQLALQLAGESSDRVSRERAPGARGIPRVQE